MKLIHQRIKDPVKGDCMKCCICSLLDLEYDQVPDLFKNGPLGFWSAVEDTLKDHGYYIRETLYNPMMNELHNPSSYCFNDRPRLDPNLSLDKLPKYMGVDRLYIGIVMSPRYFKWWDNLYDATHAVIVNRDCNIFHDPNFDYNGIKEYPLDKIIGYNGVTKVYVIERKVGYD